MSLPDDTFSQQVIRWQACHGRHDLPWQNTRDPYRVWLSEIMLQQTQVSTVIPYYQRFLERFPNVAALAAASPEAVAEAWAGLGYYARARNLHRCARIVVENHGGSFPSEAARLAELPGIGRSTAAAIAAFAFGEKAAILDGNVKRVFCRHFGIEGFPGAQPVEKSLWQLAESLLPDHGIEAYTQGLMDLGATLCTKTRPRCDDCPLIAGCIAFRDGRQEALPAAKPKKTSPLRSATFCLITDGTRVLLERRPPAGIWGGLLVAPEGEATAVLARLALGAIEIRPLPTLRHTFTHFRLDIQPILCRVEGAPLEIGSGELQWLPLARCEEAALPQPMRKLLKRLAEGLPSGRLET